MSFVDLIWSKFPEDFTIRDGGKEFDPDHLNRGILQRFMSIFGLELDDIIYPAINNFMDNVQPQLAGNDFLNYIAYALGKPLDIVGDEQLYKNLLSSIIYIYQRKGTIYGTDNSYELLFNQFGLSLKTVTENFLPPNNYDLEGLLYDNGLIYDNDSCSATCVTYDIVYKPLLHSPVAIPTDFAPLSPGNEQLMRSLITSLLDPSSAILRNLTYNAE